MKIYDLSYVIMNCMPVLMGDEPVEITQDRTLGRDGYNAIGYKTNMHAGTHVDVPMHLIDSCPSIDTIPIDKFIGNGVLIDARERKLFAYKREYENLIHAGDIVLFCTNFADLYEDTYKYYNKYPVLTNELADFLVEKKVKMVGFDTPSPDKSPYTIHKKLLENDIFVIENMTNLTKLIGVPKFTVYAVPLKIEAEACVVRAYAIEP